MQLYLTRRSLNGIAGIDLAGITPLVEKTIALGSGADYDDKSKTIELAAGQGRGLPGHDPRRQPLCLGNCPGHAAGDGGARGAADYRAGRRRYPGAFGSPCATPAPRNSLPKVQVKVIGSDNPLFHRRRDRSPRRVRRRRCPGTGHRRRPQGRRSVRLLPGDTYVGEPPQPQPAAVGRRRGRAAGSRQAGQAQNQSLDANLKMQNSANSNRQIERLQQRYNQPAKTERERRPAGSVDHLEATPPGRL